jgi:hypothetical protein
MAESNETMVSLTQARDLYSSMVDTETCEKLMDTYDKISRQCYNLAVAWGKFNGRKSVTQPLGDGRNEHRKR